MSAHCYLWTRRYGGIGRLQRICSVPCCVWLNWFLHDFGRIRRLCRIHRPHQKIIIFGIFHVYLWSYVCTRAKWPNCSCRAECIATSDERRAGERLKDGYFLQIFVIYCQMLRMIDGIILTFFFFFFSLAEQCFPLIARDRIGKLPWKVRQYLAGCSADRVHSVPEKSRIGSHAKWVD